MSAARITETAEAAEFDRVLDGVVAASATLARTAPADRAALLRAIGSAVAEAAADLTEIAMIETGLGRERLMGEVGRTAGQFRLYADVVEEGSWLDASITHAVPAATPSVDDHRRVNLPLGPVLVFAASNFPFAFGVLGTDTASALSAGCAVIAKGHPAHPRLASALADLVAAAVVASGFPVETVAFVDGVAATRVLADPRIEAGAFTGSIRGGTALLKIAQNRHRPIPFFAEMGSVNPVIVTPRAWAARKDSILDGLVASMSLSNGQLCTSPGLIFTPGAVEPAELAFRLQEHQALPLLSDAIAASLRDGIKVLHALDGVVAAVPPVLGERSAAPVVWVTDTATTARHPEIVEERFGPSSIAIGYPSSAELLDTIGELEGQLTASVFCEEDEDVSDLVAALAPKAGRLLMNAWPTGVAVSWSMHHGGPWPASSMALGSVGAEAIGRFLRPVVYQCFSDNALPPALQNANPWGISRRIDGVIHSRALHL